MMEYETNFMSDVVRGDVVIVDRYWETSWSPSSSFKDVFLSNVRDRLKDSHVEIKIGNKAPNKDPAQ